LLCREDLIKGAVALVRSVRLQLDKHVSGARREFLALNRNQVQLPRSPKDRGSPNGIVAPTALTSLEGVGAKPLLWKFAPLCVGITCIGSTSVVLFPSSYAVAAPGSANAKAVTPSTLLGAARVQADPVIDIQFPNQILSASTGSLTEGSWAAPHFSNNVILKEQDEFEAYSSPNLISETYWQAQNPTVTPPANPGVTPSNLQPNPNEDRFLQPPLSPTPQPLEPQPPLQPPSNPEQTPPNSAPGNQSAPTPSDSPTVLVQKIEVIGSTVFDPEQINPIVQPYEGRSLSVEQLREVADAITQLYLERGYITSRAILVDQEIVNGIVQIRVIEGSLSEIQIQGTRRVNPDYVRSRVQLGAGTPLNTAKLEDQLRLLRADPLFENVEASLRATGRTGQSILIVRVIEADPFEGSVGIDNYSPPSVGSERLGLNLLYRNLTGYGDQVATSFYHTTRSGADNFEFVYQLPVNPMNGTVQLRTSLTWNKIVESEVQLPDLFNIEGDSQLYEASFRQPLVRSPREEFALSLGFTWQKNQTTIGDLGFPSPGADADGVTKTSVIKFGQDYVRRDVRGAWSLRSLFSVGIGVLDATVNPAPEPDGRFVSWLGQVQRVQILNENNFLIVGADIQLTPDSLLPSQQFVVGGGQSLRGYRQNIRAGDNGVRFSIEDRITLERNEAGAAIFQLAPFFDAGYVWNDSSNPINQFLPSQRFLAGLGIGLLWEPEPGLNLRLDYGYPLIKLDDRGENAQDKGFYFSVRYQF
jgi:hemolysin activation/secretion protein